MEQEIGPAMSVSGTHITDIVVQDLSENNAEEVSVTTERSEIAHVDEASVIAEQANVPVKDVVITAEQCHIASKETSVKAQEVAVSTEQANATAGEAIISANILQQTNIDETSITGAAIEDMTIESAKDVSVISEHTKIASQKAIVQTEEETLSAARAHISTKTLEQTNLTEETPGRSEQSDNRVHNDELGQTTVEDDEMVDIDYVVAGHLFYNDEHGGTKVEDVAAGQSGQADNRIYTDERGQSTVKDDEKDQMFEMNFVGGDTSSPKNSSTESKIPPKWIRVPMPMFKVLGEGIQISINGPRLSAVALPLIDSSSDSSSEEESQEVVAEDNERNVPETPERSGQSDNRVYNDELGETKVKEFTAGPSGQVDNRIVTDEHGQTTVKDVEEGEMFDIDHVDDEDHPFMTPGEEENEDNSDDNPRRPRETGRGGPQVEEPQGDEQENKEEDEGTVVTVVRDDDDEHQRKAFKSREEEKKM
ncbi:uncharacterized protein LOC120327793 isoform X2 [Styela clava]